MSSVPSEKKPDAAGGNPAKPPPPLGVAAIVAALAGLATVASAVIAIVALVKADQASSTAQDLTAPLLAPTTPLDKRGMTITVTTQFASVLKRADFLYWNSRTNRFVVPVQNGGGGIAMTVGVPVIVEDCTKEPALLPASAIGLIGTYAVPSGETDQLGYVHPNPDLYKPGSVSADGQPLWFNFNYGVFKEIVDPLNRRLPPAANLLIWYTDGALRKLYSTCISYTQQVFSAGGVTEWAVLAQRYSSRSWPGGAPR